MSDDARTPEPPDHTWPAAPASPDSGPHAGPQDAPPTRKVGLDKQAPAPERDPWAAPADAVPPGAGQGGTPPPPSVHNQPTVTSLPAMGSALPPSPDTSTPGAATPQPWANPFAPPASGGSADPYAPPAGTMPPGGAAPHNPFAPPAGPASFGGPLPGEPVPPPPVAPGGPGQPLYGYPHYPGPTVHGGHSPYPGVHSGYGWGVPQPMPSNGMGTTSLVLGIIAAVLFCLWPVAIVLGILALVFGVIGRRRAGRGEATNPGQALAGIICGAVGLLLGIGFAVLIFALPDDNDEDPYFGTDDYSTSLVVEQAR
ncbi:MULTISPECIES: DUF4190 domain-containing protein [unclassified Streptomyces]|uniref:DUF4190 domain-containing protein n=1 Tax=unclassified Streptomyces TaxID=2593676 RepID=UPI0033A1988F